MTADFEVVKHPTLANSWQVFAKAFMNMPATLFFTFRYFKHQKEPNIIFHGKDPCHQMSDIKVAEVLVQGSIAREYGNEPYP